MPTTRLDEQQVRAIVDWIRYLRAGDVVKAKMTATGKPDDGDLGLPWPTGVVFIEGKTYSLRVIAIRDSKVYLVVEDFDELAVCVTTLGSLARGAVKADCDASASAVEKEIGRP